MICTELLTPDRVIFNHTGGSKKRLLEFCSRFLVQSIPNSNLDAEQIFVSLYAREYIGTTAIGNGIAIPHCRISNYKAPIGVLFKLKDKINFDAYDKKPVYILFFMFLPEEYCESNAQMIRKVRNVMQHTSVIDNINSCSSAEELFNCMQKHLLIEEEAQVAREKKELELLNAKAGTEPQV